MPDIGIALTGAREIDLKFEEFPQRARERLVERIRDLTHILEERIVAAAPSRTGKLRSEIRESLRETPDRITGRVGVSAEFAKAAALEYGAHGTAHLKAHEARLGHVFGRPIAPIEVMVAAHERRVNIAEHSFERGSLEAMRGEILDGLRDALSEAVDES